MAVFVIVIETGKTIVLVSIIVNVFVLVLVIVFAVVVGLASRKCNQSSQE